MGKRRKFSDEYKRAAGCWRAGAATGALFAMPAGWAGPDRRPGAVPETCRYRSDYWGRCAWLPAHGIALAAFWVESPECREFRLQGGVKRSRDATVPVPLMVFFEMTIRGMGRR